MGEGVQMSAFVTKKVRDVVHQGQHCGSTHIPVRVCAAQNRYDIDSHALNVPQAQVFGQATYPSPCP